MDAVSVQSWGISKRNGAGDAGSEIWGMIVIPSGVDGRTLVLPQRSQSNVAPLTLVYSHALNLYMIDYGIIMVVVYNRFLHARNNILRSFLGHLLFKLFTN